VTRVPRINQNSLRVTIVHLLYDSADCMRLQDLITVKSHRNKACAQRAKESTFTVSLYSTCQTRALLCCQEGQCLDKSSRHYSADGRPPIPRWLHSRWNLGSAPCTILDVRAGVRSMTIFWYIRSRVIRPSRMTISYTDSALAGKGETC
jgi:hypothetical protein